MVRKLDEDELAQVAATLAAAVITTTKPPPNTASAAVEEFFEIYDALSEANAKRGKK